MKLVSEEVGSVRYDSEKNSLENISESQVQLRMGAGMTVHASECPIQVGNQFYAPEAKSINPGI